MSLHYEKSHDFLSSLHEMTKEIQNDEDLFPLLRTILSSLHEQREI